MTKKALVLEYLKTHKKGLTSVIANEKLNVARLNTVITSLEKDGVKINKEVKKPKGKDEYTIYTLA